MIRVAVVDQDGETVELSITTPEASLSVVSDLRLDGDSVVLYDFHVDGPGAGALGPSKLREIVRAVMEFYDVDVLEIQGYRRTTGANPGRTPRPLRFARR